MIEVEVPANQIVLAIMEDNVTLEAVFDAYETWLIAHGIWRDSARWDDDSMWRD